MFHQQTVCAVRPGRTTNTEPTTKLTKVLGFKTIAWNDHNASHFQLYMHTNKLIKHCRPLTYARLAPAYSRLFLDKATIGGFTERAGTSGTVLRVVVKCVYWRTIYSRGCVHCYLLLLSVHSLLWGLAACRLPLVACHLPLAAMRTLSDFRKEEIVSSIVDCDYRNSRTRDSLNKPFGHTGHMFLCVLLSTPARVSVHVLAFIIFIIILFDAISDFFNVRSVL